MLSSSWGLIRSHRVRAVTLFFFLYFFLSLSMSSALPLPLFLLLSLCSDILPNTHATYAHPTLLTHLLPCTCSFFPSLRCLLYPTSHSTIIPPFNTSPQGLCMPYPQGAGCWSALEWTEQVRAYDSILHSPLLVVQSGFNDMADKIRSTQTMWCLNKCFNEKLIIFSAPWTYVHTDRCHSSVVSAELHISTRHDDTCVFTGEG